jgi:hypothetical protein
MSYRARILELRGLWRSLRDFPKILYTIAIICLDMVAFKIQNYKLFEAVQFQQKAIPFPNQICTSGPSLLHDIPLYREDSNSVPSPE